MAESAQDKLINMQAQQLAAQVANWAAQLDFAKERFRLLELPEMQGKSQLEIDRLAFEKAQDTWKRSFQEASLTGTYNGQPTLEWLTQQAQLTGVLNGQQTLQGKLTDAQIGQMNEQMRLANEQFLVQTTGYHQGRPTFEREQWQTGQTGYIGDQATMARQQMEANLSGYFGGRQTLAREQFGAEQTQNYLQLLSSLQANPFRQMRVLNQTPGGLQSLVNAWAGTYNMPGFGSSGSPGQTQLYDLWSGQNAGAPAGGGESTPTGQYGQYGQYGPQYPSSGPPGMPYQWNPYAQSGTPPAGGAPPAGMPPPPGAPTVPVYTGPAEGPVPPTPGEAIPGRGFTTAQWNDATRAAVAAWNAAHPGFLADGSQQGYAADPNYTSRGIPAAVAPGVTQQTLAGGAGLTGPELQRYEAILAREYQVLHAGEPSILTPGSPAYAELVGYLNRGAQNQSGTPLPNTPAGQTLAHDLGGYVSAPVNVGQYVTPTKTGFDWTGPTATPPPSSIGLPPVTPPAPGGDPFAPPPHGTAPTGPPPPGWSIDPVTGEQVTNWSNANAAYYKAQQGNQQGYWSLNEQTGQYEFVPLDPASMTGTPLASGQSAGTSGVPSWYQTAVGTATNNVNVPPYTYSPQGTQAPPASYNYSATEQGHTQVYPPGVAAPPGQEQVSTQTPMNNSTANSLLANPMPGMGGSLSPSQINAEAYSKTNPYMQNLMWQYFEDQGWDPQMAKGEFMKSLPRYAGPAQGKVQI